MHELVDQFQAPDPGAAGWAARVRDSDDAGFVEAATSRPYSRPDHRVRVGRWRENLSLEDAERLWPIVAEPAERFAYAVA